MLITQGWQVGVEKSFNHFGDRGSVDVLAWRPEAGALLIVEIKTEIANLEETLRVLDIKARVVPGVLSREGQWRSRVVGTVLVLPDATAHRNLVAQCVAGWPIPPARSAGYGSSEVLVPAVPCGT